MFPSQATMDYWCCWNESGRIPPGGENGDGTTQVGRSLPAPGDSVIEKIGDSGYDTYGHWRLDPLTVAGERIFLPEGEPKVMAGRRMDKTSPMKKWSPFRSIKGDNMGNKMNDVKEDMSGSMGRGETLAERPNIGQWARNLLDRISEHQKLLKPNYAFRAGGENLRNQNGVMDPIAEALERKENTDILTHTLSAGEEVRTGSPSNYTSFKDNVGASRDKDEVITSTPICAWTGKALPKTPVKEAKSHRGILRSRKPKSKKVASFPPSPSALDSPPLVRKILASKPSAASSPPIEPQIVIQNLTESPSVYRKHGGNRPSRVNFDSVPRTSNFLHSPKLDSISLKVIPPSDRIPVSHSGRLLEFSQMDEERESLTLHLESLIKHEQNLESRRISFEKRLTSETQGDSVTINQPDPMEELLQLRQEHLQLHQTGKELLMRSIILELEEYRKETQERHAIILRFIQNMKSAAEKQRDSVLLNFFSPLQERWSRYIGLDEDPSKPYTANADSLTAYKVNGHHVLPLESCV